MVMKMTTNFDNTKKDIEKGIVLPSMKLGKPTTYGYCKIDSKNCVSIWYMLDYKCDDICIVSSMNDGVDINISITDDGYIRFWTSNVRRYLKWWYDDKQDIIYLKSFRREDK